MGLRQEWVEFPACGAGRPVKTISRETKGEHLFASDPHAHSDNSGSVWAHTSECKSLLGYETDRFQSPLSTLDDLSIGIVVPLLNEGNTLRYFLSRLCDVSHARCPVVIVDGGSSDDSARIARKFFHTETTSAPNRGKQLNHGARCLLTDVLLFLHADSELPRGFDFYIRRSLTDPKVVGGCFRLEFDVPHPLLRFYSWFTRFSGRFLHFGDQGFFIRRDVFCRMGGFSPLPFLEDVDFLRRLRRYGNFVTLSVPVRTSARRFLQHGMVRQQLANIVLVALFELGVSAERLAAAYPHVR